MPTPDITPNVRIENPQTRKTLRTILDVIGALAFVAQMIDYSAPEFDIAFITVPILTGYAAARTVFGFAVDNPNTPK